MPYYDISTGGCGCPSCEFSAQVRADISADTSSYKNTSALYRAAPGESPYYAEALKSDYTWDNNVLSYTFSSTTGHFGDQNATGYTTMNAAQQTAVRNVLAEFTKITGLTFREIKTSEPSSVDMVFRQADLPENLAGWAYYPGNSLGSDITFDTRYNGTATGRNAEYYGIEAGQFGYRLMLHEIGHAMGLEHPFEGNVTLPTLEDSQNATVMSYNGADQGSPQGDYIGGAVASRVGPFAPQTLMIYDIAALQEMYGANHNYRAGNDVYLLRGDEAVFTIWDGNGNDTLNSSLYSGNATLDLREGLEFVSNVGNTSFWNAFGTNIENVTTGNGNDSITGNILANRLLGGGGNDRVLADEGDDTVNGNQGSDTIDGGEGNDRLMGGKEADTIYGGNGDDWINGNNFNDVVYGQGGNDFIRGGKDADTMYGGDGNDTLAGDKGNDLLVGGAGADVFFFTALSGIDTIRDFQDGIDHIELTGLGLNAGNITSVISEVGGNAVLNLGAGSAVTLTGISSALLGTDDFIFS